MSDPPSALLLLPGYGAGVYRRRIRLEADEGRVLGELRDDFHHFAVVLRHDGYGVTEARGVGLRVPWTTCGGAIAPLEKLRGLALGSTLREGGRHTDPRLQCTHLLDLALLACRHAGREAGRARQFDVSVPDRVEGRTQARLELDGSALLRWQLDGNRITAPEPFAGRSIADRDFGAFAESLGGDRGEAALVLRRAVFISIGRRHDFERMRRAAEFASVVGGACHTFSPAQLGAARRNRGSRRDFDSDTAPVFGEGFSEPFRAFLRAGERSR